MYSRASAHCRLWCWLYWICTAESGQDYVFHLTSQGYCSTLIRLKWQTRLLVFHSKPHTHTLSAVPWWWFPSFLKAGACVSSTAGVTQHGAQGRRSNVISAVDRTRREGLIALRVGKHCNLISATYIHHRAWLHAHTHMHNHKQIFAFISRIRGLQCCSLNRLVIMSLENTLV